MFLEEIVSIFQMRCVVANSNSSSHCADGMVEEIGLRVDGLQLRGMHALLA